MRQKTMLDVWVVDLTFPGYMTWWAERAREFEERHPDYEVDIVRLDFFSGPRDVSAAIEAGRRPAVAEYYFYLNQVARDTLAPDGSPQFTSVEAAVGGRAEILGEPVVLGDIIPALREYYSDDGLTSMPSVGTTSVLYGNAGVLESAGASRMPRTWGDVEDTCEAVAGLAGGPAHGITWSNHGMFFQQALAAQGGLLTDNDNGRSGRATTIDLAAPEMLAWARWWRRLHRRGHYLYTGRIPDWQGTFQAFADERTALRLSSSNDVDYMVQAAKTAGFGLDVGACPYNGDVPHAGNAVAGSSLWLSDRLDERTRDGALAFLQFVHNPRNAADRHKRMSFLPLTGSAFALLEEEGWFAANPHHRVPSEQLAAAPGEGGRERGPAARGAMFGNFARIQDIMTRAMHDVLVDDVDVTGRFARATAEARLRLREYNSKAPAIAPGGVESLCVEFFTDAGSYSGADLEKVAELRRR
ncbi:extracellular solute-binding protein [Actinomadura fibrosa]|uniref:Extracellular solute-binding protein n=1 Tax=Actinomadura fibrosa TaxID=111802 RepID=A0ABW2Y4F9_9ACTN|nr:extracellular solute-binding protein [Actinomadura fibrosa]